MKGMLPQRHFHQQFSIKAMRAPGLLVTTPSHRGTYTPDAMHSSKRSTPRSTIWLLEVPYGYMKLGVVSVTPRAKISRKEKQQEKQEQSTFKFSFSAALEGFSVRTHSEIYLETREGLNAIFKVKRRSGERMLGRQGGERRKRMGRGSRTIGMGHQESPDPQ